MLQTRLATVGAKVSLVQHLHYHAAACHPVKLETVQSASDELVAFLFRAVVPGANPPAVTSLHLLCSACLSTYPRRSAVTMLCNEIHCVAS